MLRAVIKSLLAYKPLAATARVRAHLAGLRSPDRPYCPDWQGDLIHALITHRGLREGLEVGFGTGSTALYALAAFDAAGGGALTSIDFSPSNFNDLGRRNIAGFERRSDHALVEENSNTALPRLFAEGRRFDYVFLDGWKTFDHLVMETYFVARMLRTGGVLVLDDSYMDSVDRLTRLLTRYYGFKEVDYAGLGQTGRLRLWLALIHRTLRRPYRAFVKAVDIDGLPVAQDWNFDRPL